MTPHPLAALRGRDVEVGRAFGMAHDERRNALSPCPACGAERRHPKRGDRRPAIGLRRDGKGWQCHACDITGDAVTLAALHTVGEVPPKGSDRWRRVLNECAERGLFALESGTTAPRTTHRPLPSAMPPSPPRRLEARTVAAAWGACLAVTEDAGVSSWIASRGLDAATVEERDLARALPLEGPLPRWMRFEGESWRERGLRVIVPLYGPTGALESLHARCLAPREENGRDKAASPAGAEVRGLVMADALGRLLLSGGALADGTPAAELVARVGVVVAEGVPDFLTWATRWSEAAEDAPAVFGIVAGSWTGDIAEQVPDGAKVCVRTHDDGAGRKYAGVIADSLSERCHVLAPPPGGGHASG